MKKWTVVLGLYDKTISQKIAISGSMVSAVANSAEYFPNPAPSLSAITKAIEELRTAYANSRDGSREAIAIMYTKVFNLEIELIDLGNYVLSIANRSNEIGKTIILAAGMQVKNQRNGSNRIFNVTNTNMDGRVKLQTKGEGRAGYVWQHAIDEEDWITSNITVKATTTINNLTQGKRYYFRVAVVNKDRQGPWSGAISLIVT